MSDTIKELLAAKRLRERWAADAPAPAEAAPVAPADELALLTQLEQAAAREFGDAPGIAPMLELLRQQIATGVEAAEAGGPFDPAAALELIGQLADLLDAHGLVAAQGRSRTP